MSAPFHPPSWAARALSSIGMCLLAACADASDPPAQADAASAPQAPAWTVAVLPDTQFYACAYPQIFERQTQWLAEQARARGIGLVLHTGDIVDHDLVEQWQVAAASLQRLDGRVPYLLTTGNHDLSAGRESLIDDFFSAEQLAEYDLVTGSRDPIRLDNTFAVVELAGRRWLFLGLEFGPRDAVVRWAADVLRAHAELPALVFTHAYLYSDGRRYDRAMVPPQPYHPDLYAFTPEQGIHDGEDLWRSLIEPNPNVRLVLSGHVIPDGTARAVATRADGSRVHELLANYQLCDLCPCAEVEGGGGYLRLLEFDAQGSQLRVTTYSPYLDAWLDDDENQFVLELE
jgi:hypothetical protein